MEEKRDEELSRTTRTNNDPYTRKYSDIVFTRVVAQPGTRYK